ncbi:MAG: glycosyltransferase family 39 protein [Phycisphaerales bacterium]|nr:glycosyltransferase family 39 protein [Planctomycetota bacterium]MCH8509353.1 glycosyltransferase family 39 protein [Phycisphaerales bacterium]
MRVRPGHIVLIVLAWALVALPGLRHAGGDGLTMSEGHRVAPAIEMLETGEWLVPHMFGQAYLRKPPGGIWAFAGMIGLTGDHVLGPRLASAAGFLLLALGAWWFGRRWFGETGGLAAGLATALTPMLWNPARSAELESLNNLFAALAAWTAIELATRRACRPNLALLALGAFVAGQMLVKGPAGLPAMGGMLIGAAWAARSWKPLAVWRVWAGLGLGAGVFAGVWLAIEARVSASGVEAVRQLPTAFLFDTGRALDLAAFLPLVLLGALPMSLAMLFPWGPDARAEADEGGREAAGRLHMARLLTLGALAGVGMMLLAGVSNPRYAQPIIATLGPLAGWGVAGVLREGVFRAHRKRIGWWLTLGGPQTLGVVLLAGSLVFAFVVQARVRSTGGEPAGRHAAGVLIERMRDDAAGRPLVVLADGVIEARPETLLAFREEAARLGVPVEIRWVPGLAQITHFDILAAHDARWAVLRQDDLGDERVRMSGWDAVHHEDVHKFRFVWCLLPHPDW